MNLNKDKILRHKQLLLSIAIGLGCLGIIILSLISLSNDSKSSYRPYDFDRDPWLTDFRKNYPADPQAIALKVAGYPNVDGTHPSEVHIY